MTIPIYVEPLASVPVTVEPLGAGTPGVVELAPTLPVGGLGPTAIPEVPADPASPQPGAVWVRRTGDPILSHTLLTLGLTMPGVSYALRYRTQAGVTVGCPLT